MVKNIFINKFNSILKYGFILTSILLVLLSCTNETQSYKLNLNENTYLLDGKPYTGMVIDKQRKSRRIISSFKCMNGKIEGLRLKYYRNGKIYSKQFYKNGLLHGISKRFYQSGRLEVLNKYKFGKLIGKQIEYDDDDDNSIIYYETIRNGLRNGKFHWYDIEDESIGSYHNGLMNGLWIYKKRGIVVAKGYFKDGDGSNQGYSTDIPMHGRINKWYFKIGNSIQYQNHYNGKLSFDLKLFDESKKLLYSSKVIKETQDQFVIYGTPNSESKLYQIH
jgi:antitoxin component YwqK of YwqJK toxin-antitoxin module